MSGTPIFGKLRAAIAEWYVNGEQRGVWRVKMQLNDEAVNRLTEKLMPVVEELILEAERRAADGKSQSTSGIQVGRAKHRASAGNLSEASERGASS